MGYKRMQMQAVLGYLADLAQGFGGITAASVRLEQSNCNLGMSV